MTKVTGEDDSMGVAAIEECRSGVPIMISGFWPIQREVLLGSGVFRRTDNGSDKERTKIDSDSMDDLTSSNVNGEVECNHVVFAYPSRPETLIFRDLCLKIPAGKTVALVGGNGSGKSTVISLLQRFYDPLGGEILLDGVVNDELQLKWLRSQISLVSQEPALFAASIMENMLLAKEDATADEVVDAAKASNAHQFICQLPHGYDTQVSTPYTIFIS
ncbi:hypothetical protein Nepgr_017563 [Nepenthes gracilis]|uniref:ABC transporter domain-containing protein n=1 Tax=Nepenthes gracilis TaxID=150966 RepID=A0AAD3SSK4_NEPGR|nr:hypothetical protein Nepgr_017563 [Nepenthes gracilis]